MPVRTPESIVAEAQSLLRLITVMEAHDRSRPGSPLRRDRAEARQWVQDIIARNRAIVEAPERNSEIASFPRIPAIPARAGIQKALAPETS